MSELTKPIEEAFSQMAVPGESGGHLTRFARENYYLTSFKQVQGDTKHLFNSFRNVENANEFIDAMKRDLNWFNDVAKELKDNVTELAMHFENSAIEKAFAEHFWVREAHREAIETRESTYEKLVK